MEECVPERCSALFDDDAGGFKEPGSAKNGISTSPTSRFSIVLPGRKSAETYSGKHKNRPSGRPSALAPPIRIRPKSGPET